MPFFYKGCKCELYRPMKTTKYIWDIRINDIVKEKKKPSGLSMAWTSHQ